MSSNARLTKEQMIQEYMQDSKNNLDCSAHNIRGGFYKQAVNRAYYCALDAINACLTTIDITDHKNHGYVIGEFRKNFIKTKIFAVNISDNLGELFESRNDSDYSKGFQVDISEAEDLMLKAEEIYDAVKVYIDSYSSKPK